LGVAYIEALVQFAGEYAELLLIQSNRKAEGETGTPVSTVNTTRSNLAADSIKQKECSLETNS
jgi:hypothetical protein